MVSNVWDCDCGFTDSKDPTKSIFTNFLAVDFTSISQEQLDDIFISATYKIHKSDAPFSRNFFAEQVHLSADGLDLTASPPSDEKFVPCGQIFSRAKTYFYGSYHARIRATKVPGTVTAFFNYNNDDSEVDIEYVSAWDEPTLLYTVKPQIYTDRGNPENSTYTREALKPTSSSAGNTHEWSFIWIPDIVHYGIGNEYNYNLTTNVPSAPGRLALNQWSDGNANYSLGPPKEDSTSTVTFLWAVYNVTDRSNPACKKATSPCIITDGSFQATKSSGGSGGSNSDEGPVIDVNNSGPYASDGRTLYTTSHLWPSLLLFFLVLVRRFV